MKRLSRIIIFLAVFYGASVAWLYFQQHSMLYHPFSGPHDPTAAGLKGFTAHTLGDDIIYWQHDAGASAPVLLYFHGNGGGLFAFTGALQFLADRGFTVLALEYPGYPKGAKGTPSEQKIVFNALHLYDYAAQQFPQQNIVIWGYSLGSAVATQVAAAKNERALVLEAPPSAVADRAQEFFPWVPVKYLLRDQYRTRDVIATTGSPLFIMHGDADLLIPISHGEALYKAAAEPKTFKRYEGADHFNLQQHGAYDDAVRFLRTTLEP